MYVWDEISKTDNRENREEREEGRVSLRALIHHFGEVKMKQFSSQCSGSREKFVFYSFLLPSILPALVHGTALHTVRVCSPQGICSQYVFSDILRYLQSVPQSSSQVGFRERPSHPLCCEGTQPPWSMVFLNHRPIRNGVTLPSGHKGLWPLF